MSTLKNRLAIALARRKKAATSGERISKAALARACEVTSPSVADWFSGETQSLEGSNLVRAANYLRVNPTWLATGRGRMAADGETFGEASAGDNFSPGPDIRALVPLISWVQAGEWNEIEDHFQPGDAERWLACTAAHSERTYALRVEGDSMQASHGRSYPPNCIIFVDPEKRSPINGQRIIARLDGATKATFKVYKNEDGRQWLQPLNPSHEPIRDPFSVLGTVIGKWEDE